MGRPKKAQERSPEISVRLTLSDYARLNDLSISRHATKTDLVREAVIQYLDRIESKMEEQVSDRVTARLSEIEKRLIGEQKKGIERLAKISSRCLIDLGIINQVLYRRADKETRDKLWEAARQGSLNRLGVGKKQGDPDAAELASNALSGEA
ncbi:MAG: ribbon-helix-helix protein, CopG family [Candidatus Obscuribacterales bacterium]|nr:ribbon-helix-helix protein, CopG family [Candidatus Obscuribacterales bacterium]